MSSSTQPAPTARQLGYLRALAARTGTTFASPATRREASLEIDRLRKLETEPGAPRHEAGDVNVECTVYATAVDPSEVSGFGSSATWRGASPPRASAYPTEKRPGGSELARYEVTAGERVLCRERVESRVRLTDRPRSGAGRSYLVEEGIESDGEVALEALVADYVTRARLLDAVPMGSSAARELSADRADV